MPSTQEQTYQAPAPLPHFIERDAVNDLSLGVYSSGSLVAPTSGTVTVYDASNTKVVDGQAVTIAGDKATYTYNAPSSLQLGENWRVVWVLSIAGATHTFRQEAMCVRRRLYCPISDSDLYRRSSSLDPSSSTAIHSKTTFQDQITEAFTTIQLRLIEEGNRPNLVISPSALREVSMELALAYVYQDLDHRLQEAYMEHAEQHMAAYHSAWKRVQLRYDEDDDGQGDQARRLAKPSVVWLL